MGDLAEREEGEGKGKGAKRSGLGFGKGGVKQVIYRSFPSGHSNRMWPLGWVVSTWQIDHVQGFERGLLSPPLFGLIKGQQHSYIIAEREPTLSKNIAKIQ